MARNASGVYSLPAGTAATANARATAAQFNDRFNDLATDANTARPVVAGGTGASTPSSARTNLGVRVGADVQAYNANLESLSGLTLAADRGLYSTSADTLSLFTLTSAGRALLDDADTAAQRATLGLGGLAVLDILDEDGMATNSATRPPSQQSVVVYIASLVLGIGQTWQDMSGSRSVDTSYQNATGRPIQVAISSGTNSSVQVSANASTWVNLNNIGSDPGEAGICFTVPAEHYYRQSGGTIREWSELR